MSDPEYAPSPWEPVADHVERYLATDGKDGFDFNGAQCIILSTTGRKSGKLRRTPLIRVHDGATTWSWPPWVAPRTIRSGT